VVGGANLNQKLMVANRFVALIFLDQHNVMMSLFVCNDCDRRLTGQLSEALAICVDPLKTNEAE